MPTDSSNDTQNGALGVVPKEPEMVAVHAASTTPHVESIQEIKKETQEEVQHAKSRIKVKRFIPTFLIGVVLGLLSVFGATLYLYIQESQVKISDVRVTNVADGSFTVTWVTDKEAKSAVYYSKDDNWVPLFNFLNKSKEYDDRDVTSDDKGKETIENKGDYYTHHVTLEGLTPNERYYFRIGTGVVKAFDKDVDGNKIEPIMTGPTLDALSTPYPIYGRVFKQDRTALEDSLVYVQLKDETAQTSTWLSTYTAAQGTWTVDLSNARHLHLEEGFRIDDDVARIVEVHGAVAGETSLFLTDENDQPAPDVYLGEESEVISYTPVKGVFDKLVLSAEAQTSVTWSCNGINESNVNVQNGFAAVWCHPELRWKWEAGGNSNSCGGSPSLPVGDPACNPSVPPTNPGSSTCGGWDCNGFCLTDQGTMSNFESIWCDGQARWKWERAGGNDSCGGSATVLQSDPSCTPVGGGGTVVKDSANDPDQQYRCGLRESACGAYCGGGYDTKWNFCNNNSKGVAVGNCQCLTKGSGGGNPPTGQEGGPGSPLPTGAAVDTCQTSPNDKICNTSNGNSGCGTNETCAGISGCGTKGICQSTDPGNPNNYERCANLSPVCSMTHLPKLEIKDKDNNIVSTTQTVGKNCVTDTNNEVRKYYCCPAGFSIFNGTCVSNSFVIVGVDLPDCPANIHVCTRGRLTGGTHTVCKDKGDKVIDAYCCPANTQRIGSKCESIGQCSDIAAEAGCAASLEGPAGSTYSVKCMDGAAQVSRVCCAEGYVRDGAKCSPTTTPSPTATVVPTIKDQIQGVQDDKTSEINIKNNVLGAEDTPYVLEVTESGIYNINVNGQNKQAEVFVPEGGKGTIRVFYDLNSDGTKQEDEPFVEKDQIEVKLELNESHVSYNFNNGWNLIGLNLSIKDIRTAGDLLTYLNRNGAFVTHIATYDEGQFLIFSRRNGVDFGNDFSLIPGNAYFIKNYNSSQIALKGNKFAEGVPVDLNNGWNLLSIVKPNSSLSGEKVLDSMNSQNIKADALSFYESGLYTSLVKENGLLFGRDFPIVSTRGYFVRVVEGGGTRWTP